MKIEIEITSREKATLTIDGKKMHVEKSPSITSLKGIKTPKTDNTLGGIAACQLYSKIGDVMTALKIASYTDGDVKTWGKLSKEAVDEIGDRLW